jgi:predicted porin
MQKKLIALAVAGLASGAAFAQSNVTIYGIADAAYVYSSGDNSPTSTNVHKGQSLSAIQSGGWSGSRLGFKGEEALGNGLKAIFNLEYSLYIDTNNGVGSNAGATNAMSSGSGGAASSLQARQTWVGLSGSNWGQATLGRQYSPGYSMLRNAAWAGATPSPWSRLSNTNGMTITPNSAARWNNSIAYASPNWSGFSVKTIYGFGENTSSNTLSSGTSDGGAFALGGNYANGPFNIDLLYQQTKTGPSAVSTADGKARNEWYIGGNYDFKVVKVFGSYQTQSRDDVSAGSTLKQDSNVWQLGISAPIGAHGLIMATYGESDIDNGIVGNKDSKAKGYGIAYQHKLSKRTALYTGIVAFDNKNSTAATVASAADQTAVSSGVGVSGGLNQDNTTFMAGMTHSF